MGILDIVNRILAVLPDGKTEVELHLRFGLGIEEIAAGIDGDLVEQVGKGDRFAGTLGHTHDFAVTHKLDKLHQHDVKPLRTVEPERVHRALEAGNMTVVVGAPNIDDLVKAADRKLIIMIGNVAGKVGVEAVGAAQHVVLEIELVDLLVLLAGLSELLARNIGGTQPKRALLFIGPAELRQLVHRLGDKTAVMQRGLEEPLVKLNAVALEVRLHFGNIVRKTEVRQRVTACLLIGVKQTVAVFRAVRLGKLADIVAVVAVLRELDGVLALDQLDIARLDALGKLVDLVAEVVDIELTPHIRAGPVEHFRERVAQNAAARIAHVHGAGGVGGDELDHVFLALETLTAAEIPALALNGGNDVGIPLPAEAEVQKAGTGDLNRGEIGSVKLHAGGQNIRHLARILVQRLGSSQTERRGIVAVGGILGDLNGGDRRHAFGQELFLHGCGIRLLCQLNDLVFCTLDHVHMKYLILWFLNRRKRSFPRSTQYFL